MEREWRCTKCGTLLGVGCETRIDLRYKQAQYIVSGDGFIVTAVCRNCLTDNEMRGGCRQSTAPRS